MTRITFTYTSRDGEVSQRLVRPLGLFFADTGAYRRDPQWLLRAFDLEKNSERTFAMKNVRDWKPV